MMFGARRSRGSFRRVNRHDGGARHLDFVCYPLIDLARDHGRVAVDGQSRGEGRLTDHPAAPRASARSRSCSCRRLLCRRSRGPAPPSSTRGGGGVLARILATPSGSISLPMCTSSRRERDGAIRAHGTAPSAGVSCACFHPDGTAMHLFGQALFLQADGLFPRRSRRRGSSTSSDWRDPTPDPSAFTRTFTFVVDHAFERHKNLHRVSPLLRRWWRPHDPLGRELVRQAAQMTGQKFDAGGRAGRRRQTDVCPPHNSAAMAAVAGQRAPERRRRARSCCWKRQTGCHSMERIAARIGSAHRPPASQKPQSG